MCVFVSKCIQDLACVQYSYLMEWQSNVTNRPESFRWMVNDNDLDILLQNLEEAVDESRNENRDWNDAIKD